MNFIDRYAYCSRLRRVEPVIKILFAVLILGICIWANNFIVSLVVLVFMSAVTLIVGKTPYKTYLTLLCLPLSFLIMGIITIAIDYDGNMDLYYFSIVVGHSIIGVSKEGLFLAMQIFFKSFASVACLYFLSLSTPMVDLLSGLKELKVPVFLIEIMGLIYRFIFILLEMSERIIIAQSSRLGYISLRRGFQSLGTLVSVLFIRAYKKSEDVYMAMEARGYDAEINLLKEDFENGKALALLLGGFVIFIFCVTLYLKGLWW